MRRDDKKDTGADLAFQRQDIRDEADELAALDLSFRLGEDDQPDDVDEVSQ